jgi:hypothetical protein
VTVEVAPEAEAAWAKWMAEEHIPAVVRIGRFLGATRWKDQARTADGWSRYVMQYRAEGTATIEAYQRSTETAALRDDFLARFGKVTRLERTVLVEPLFIAPER